ncbi:unnamed protein product [Phytophthora fragariaefolia]|uniref:Unnamed protein product n=1 Tax=Phytophthora fragariaefolia TaxID=1490495 RepID=A0A9W7CGT7_9STRA|nr:unnamed protein product [Phytophthora fragariaefolia]
MHVKVGAIADISVVMAKYPVDEGGMRSFSSRHASHCLLTLYNVTGIIRFSAAALREIAETSLSHSPSKTVHEKARVILDEDLPAYLTSSTPDYPTKRVRLPTSGTSSHNRDTSPRATARHLPKSPTIRPSTSSGIPTPGNARSFGQLSHALGDAPGVSFFTSPVKLADESRTSTPKASRLPPPRSRDEHIQRAGEMKRRNNGNGQRDRLLMKTYGNVPLGSKIHRADASSDAFGPATDRGFSRDNSSSRFSPLKNNYLGTEGVTFVIPPPLSSSQSMEQPIASRGTKTPTRPHSARLTPLINERVKISTARFPNAAANVPDWGSGDGAWPMDTSMSTGHLRPQTAVVVTKLSDPTNQWERKTDQAAGYRKKDRGGLRERKRERDSPGLSKTARPSGKPQSSGERDRSPTSRRKGPSLPHPSSVNVDSENTTYGQYCEASSSPAPRVSSAAMDMDQSMAELREFAQQLLKEEARISSLLAQTGSKSPGLNRMSFSDKLHKMIEIAESSMYERSLALSGSHGLSDAPETPPKTARATPGKHAERPIIPASDVSKPPTEGAKVTSLRKSPLEAEAKASASDAHATPKMLSSGYKKSRASTMDQKKQHKTPGKVGAVSPKADRKVVSKLDPTVRAPSIPFLEPLQIGPVKAPAKQDIQQEEKDIFNLTVDTLSNMEDSPQKKEEEREMICEESIQEDIPMTAMLQEIPRALDEKEDEPVPEHIDVKNEEGYHDVDAIVSLPSLRDAVEESPIGEEIGFVSPSKNEANPDKPILYLIQPIANIQDDSYDDDQATFEPEESCAEMGVAAIPSDNPVQQSYEASVKEVVEPEHFTLDAILSESEAKKVTITPPITEGETCEAFAAPEAEAIIYQDDTCGRKSEDNGPDITLVPSEIEPSYYPASEQKDADVDGFEFIELPDFKDNLEILFDWTTARDTCQEFVTQGISNALVEVEAMGGLYTLLPHENTATAFLHQDDDSEVPATEMPAGGNNDDAIDIQSQSEIDTDASTIAPSDSALLNALQNVVSTLPPSTVLAQEILASIQDNDKRIQRGHVQSNSEDMVGEIGRIVASTIAGSLSSAVEQLLSLPLGLEGNMEYSQSLSELVAVAVKAVAQRIRAEGDGLLINTSGERCVPDAAIPVPPLTLSLSNNNDSEVEHCFDTLLVNEDQPLSQRTGTPRSDDSHMTVQMAKAIQDSVNGIIAMSLVSVMQQFDFVELGGARKGPEFEGEDESVAMKQLEKQSFELDMNESMFEKENDVILPAKVAVAVGGYVNGLIALSVQNSVERALENRSSAENLNGLTVMAVNLYDTPRQESILMGADVHKPDVYQPSPSKPTIHPVGTSPQENNAEEELSVQTVIAISRSVDGIIALSLEKTVTHLCSTQPKASDEGIEDQLDERSRTDTQAGNNNISTPPLLLPSPPLADEYAVSDDVSIAIRRNISAVVAVTLESVLQRLQDADEQLEQQRKEGEGEPLAEMVENRELQQGLCDLTVPREPAAGRIEQTPQQDFQDQDDATADLESLPVAMSISIQRSVNVILMQALQNVISDLTHELSVGDSEKHGKGEELHSRQTLSDQYNDEHEMESINYDHAAIMTAIETFDQLKLSDDGDNQTSDQDSRGISIQMAIAVRWTVSGMIALAVENAITDTMHHSAPRQHTGTPAEKSLETHGEGRPGETFNTAETDTIAQDISSDMAVAIRQTVDGIIERTTEYVLSQIGAHTVKELVSQLVETTASLNELPVGASSDAISLSTRPLVAPDEISEEEEKSATLPIQMSLAIRQAVNGLIGLSLQAVLEGITGGGAAKLSLESSERNGSDKALVHSLIEDLHALGESSQTGHSVIPPLSLPLSRVRDEVPTEKVELDKDHTEEVSVMAAIAISRTVTAVIAAGVERMLDSMASVSASLATGQDSRITSFEAILSGDDRKDADTFESTLKEAVCTSSLIVQDAEDEKDDDVSEATLSTPSGDDSAHDPSIRREHANIDDTAYENCLSPAMSIAVAVSVRAMLTEAVNKASQRIDFPRAYKDDIQFVKEEVLGTSQMEDHAEYYRSLAEDSDAVVTALASVVNSMTATTLASIGNCVVSNPIVAPIEIDQEDHPGLNEELQRVMNHTINTIAYTASLTQTHDNVNPSDSCINSPQPKTILSTPPHPHDEVRPAVAQAVEAVSEAASEAASEAEVAAVAGDLLSAVESAAQAVADQDVVVETPVAAQEVSELTPEVSPQPASPW